jgi:hypothetical protein
MVKIKTILAISAVAAFAFASDTVAQDCASCTTTNFGYAQNSCGGGAGCRGGTLADHWSQSKAKWHAYNKTAKIVRQRNQAWPKPFECHDRQVYFATFYPMYQRGYDVQTTLTDAHFDEDTNELNTAGKQKIAGIMQNLPLERRQLLVFENGNTFATDKRVEQVRSAAKEWFGHLGDITVAKTTMPAYGQSADLVQKLNSDFAGALPNPGISVSSGGGVSGGGN